MTNHLTYTDLDTTTTIRPPTGTIPSTPASHPDGHRNERKWILFAGGAAVAVAAAVGISNLGGGSVSSVPPQVVEQRPAYLIIQDEIDAALAGGDAVADLIVQRPAYLIIQNEIDAVLAQRNGLDVGPHRPTAQIIQDEIDDALAEHNSASSGSTEN